MASIAIIDDNMEHSGTVQTNIELGLEELGSNLKVITSLPFKNPNDYFAYLNENEVSVLILDEKLNDLSIDEHGPVGYKGSELVTLLRAKLPDFPIFALTVIPTEGDLIDKYSEYEDIISREEFYKDANKYVPKFWRAAKNYLNANVEEFSEYNELTQLIAGGNNDPEMLKKLQALQLKLELPFSGFDDRNLWLAQYESQITSLNELNELIKSKLSN
jgi:hypothetical protein